MRAFAFLSATLLGAVGVSYSSYELLKPKNIAQYLQWQGYKLVSDNESTWKAIYEENRGFFVSFKELRNYCSNELKSNNYEELDRVAKYCIDQIKTVKGQLIREGLDHKLMNEEEQYKAALFLRKSNYEFLNTIGVSTVIEEKQVKTDPAKLIVDIADIFSSGAIYLKDKDNKSEAFWSIDFSTTKDSSIPKGFKESSTSFKGKEPSFDTIGHSNEEVEMRKNYVFSDVWNSESIKNLKEVFTKWAKEGEVEFFTSYVRQLNDKATGFTVWKKHKEHWYHFNIAWNFNKVWQYEQAALWGLHFPFVDRYIQHQYLEVGNLIPVAVEELRILNYINTKSDIFKNRGYETRRLPDSLFIRHILCPSCSPLSTKEVNEMYQGERKIDINQKDIETLARGSWRDRWGSWIISAEKREATDPIKKYREWCEESLTKAPSSARLINTKAFCFAKEFRTGEERLKYDGRTKFTREQLRDSYVSLGIDKFKDYESNTLIRDLGGLELRKNQDAFTDAYEKYCNTEGSKAIYELDYSKYFTRCSFKN